MYICFLPIGVLPQPVFTDGVNYVEVKISEAAFFNLHFHSLLPDFTLCEWRKDHHKLTVSKKYQFSPLSQIDPTNVDTVLCSLEVLNVSVDDVGNYSCTTHYNKSFSFSMKRKMLYNDSNLRRVELKLAGKTNYFLTKITLYALLLGDSSNSSESTSKTAQIIFGGVVGVFIIIGGVAGVILKGSSILDFLRKYCCKEFVQGNVFVMYVSLVLLPWMNQVIGKMSPCFLEVSNIIMSLLVSLHNVG